MKRFSRLALVLVVGAFVLGGCVTTREALKTGCQYKERDLTVAWAQRAYWCEPKAAVEGTRRQGQSLE